ncbi:hypothetical protein AB0H43_36695 [Hamadaea sp. NPDC050747]|uniref:hypothetical protein n=1 Tax=Hamadaea sp. NPDC050747 TaxID=3155789 RepID=UPI00340E96D6
MTAVNWERHPGETIEQFIAAMLLLDHPHGNLITPSQGDRGVDVRIEHPDGFDVYQIKRYTGPLTSAQRREVTKSWKAFATQTLPALRVRAWYLVTPWDPTNERLEWLDGLTAGAGVPSRWVGRAALDGMASRHPRLIGYYFGDGGAQILELMAATTAAGKELQSDLPADALLEAVVLRQRHLARALSEVDPFYRYSIDVRAGRMADLPFDADPAAAATKYHQIDEEHYSVLKVYPLASASAQLRPIQFTLHIEVQPGSAEQEAMQAFFRHGAPFENMPGNLIKVSGPPGVGADGLGLISFLVKSAPSDLPDLELRVVSPDGAVLETIPLVDIKASHGVDGGDGAWLGGTDRSKSLQVQFLLHGEDGDELWFNSSPTVGKLPADVLPIVRMTAQMIEGNQLILAVRGGQPVTSPWPITDSEAARLARRPLAALEALQTVQQHVFQRVVVPDFDTLPAQEINDLLFTASMLRGEQVQQTWQAINWPITANGPDPDALFHPILTRPLTLRLAGFTYEFELDVRTICTARFEDPEAFRAGQEGDIVRAIPGNDPYAYAQAVPRSSQSNTASS